MMMSQMKGYRRPTQGLRWKDYCPQLRPLKTWNELITQQVNKEAELIVPDREMPRIDNKSLVRWVKSQRVKRFDAGIYNFVTYQIKKILP